MTDFAMLLVPGMTQLDFTGPYEVFARCPDAKVHLVWKSLAPVVTEHGLAITPTATLASIEKTGVLFVPGGGGINALLTDGEVLDWVRRVAGNARYITSVCTGALVLGAAGLLKGKRAATHWTAMEMLPLFGALPEKRRVVIDGNVVTGGGVTAGIDFGLQVAAELLGREVAQTIQLSIEYNPAPPFDYGDPDSAPPDFVAAFRKRSEPRQEQRWAQVRRAAQLLGER